jgi:hypothetical protein
VSNPATKQQRYRQRRAEGRAVFRVEADPFALADMLVAEKFLEEWDSDDRRKVEAALQTAIQVWSCYR